MDVDTLDSPKVELETNVVEKETLVEKHTNGKDYKAEMLSMQIKYQAEIATKEPVAAVRKPEATTPENGKAGEKRKAQFPELFSASGAKKTKSGPVQPKNACVALNEYRPGLEYVIVDQTGSSHEPKFKVKVTVNETEFIGEGRSKKQAKQAAAECALKSIIQFRNPLEAQVAMGKAPKTEVIDFTEDSAPNGQAAVNTFGDNKPPQTKPNGKPKLSPTKSKEPPKPSVNEYKNPIMSLNELRPGLKYESSESGSTAATKRFKTTVTIDDVKFEGSGSSKKFSKQASARAALSKLYGASFTPTVTAKHDTSAEKMVAGTGIPLSKFSMDQEVADNVGRMILDKFEALVEGNLVASRRKVIAGVVMSRGGTDMTNLEIISVTTGTKCINGEYMSAAGKGLNDSHAEILSRRCLVRYLYSELEKITASGSVPEDCILEKGSKGGYAVKSDARFHLYINTAPCGDARIFSPHEEAQSQNSESDRHVNRRSRGQLRTKIESGEGTIPVTSSDGIQTWDGVMQGSRLLTMSCSDKVCRWNVVGVQGALLAYFLEPVYFHSIVLGSLFHSTHMLRAVTGRVKSTLSGLPQPYRLNTPKLNLLSSPEARQPRKSPNHSINWTKGG